ncbi:MAG: hypothetical protein AAF211_19910, partial [Myxococcota bacterium]
MLTMITMAAWALPDSSPLPMAAEPPDPDKGGILPSAFQPGIPCGGGDSELGCFVIEAHDPRQGSSIVWYGYESPEKLGNRIYALVAAAVSPPSSSVRRGGRGTAVVILDGPERGADPQLLLVGLEDEKPAPDRLILSIAATDLVGPDPDVRVPTELHIPVDREWERNPRSLLVIRATRIAGGPTAEVREVEHLWPGEALRGVRIAHLQGAT